MSKKGRPPPPPKPEELIQKLEERFNSFKVWPEKLEQMEFVKEDEFVIMTGGG